MKKRTIIIECRECSGTGLYKGMMERDNCASVCKVCKGTGAEELRYNEFKGRKIRTDIKRVFSDTNGYVHSDLDAVVKGIGIVRFSKGGAAYKDWLNGEELKPVKELYCPYMYKDRMFGEEPLELCKKHCKSLRITECEIYHKKEECWAKFESICGKM